MIGSLCAYFVFIVVKNTYETAPCIIHDLFQQYSRISHTKITTYPNKIRDLSQLNYQNLK